MRERWEVEISETKLANEQIRNIIKDEIRDIKSDFENDKQKAFDEVVDSASDEVEAIVMKLLQQFESVWRLAQAEIVATKKLRGLKNEY